MTNPGAPENFSELLMNELVSHETGSRIEQEQAGDIHTDIWLEWVNGWQDVFEGRQVGHVWISDLPDYDQAPIQVIFAPEEIAVGDDDHGLPADFAAAMHLMHLTANKDYAEDQLNRLMGTAQP